MYKKIILITGGTAGVGLEKADLLEKMGNIVIVCGRSNENIELAKKRNNNLITIKADITKEGDREEIYKFVENKFGHLDYLINNAGIVKRYLLSKEKNIDELIDYEMEINYKAPILMTKLFLDLLKRSAGTVVNVTSGLIYTPIFLQANYCASKSALHSFTISLREQLKSHNIRVKEIIYPELKTDFQDGFTSNRAMNPKEAAIIAIKGLASNNDEIIVKMAKILKLLCRIMPKRMEKIFNNMIRKNYMDFINQI